MRCDIVFAQLQNGDFGCLICGLSCGLLHVIPVNSLIYNWLLADQSSATWLQAVSASGRLTRARSASSPKPLAVSESGSSLFNRLRRHFRVARRLESCELALLSREHAPFATPHGLR
jgi:hypothetical protein